MEDCDDLSRPFIFIDWLGWVYTDDVRTLTRLLGRAALLRFPLQYQVHGGWVQKQSLLHHARAVNDALPLSAHSLHARQVLHW